MLNGCGVPALVCPHVKACLMAPMLRDGGTVVVRMRSTYLRERFAQRSHTDCGTSPALISRLNILQPRQNPSAASRAANMASRDRLAQARPGLPVSASIRAPVEIATPMACANLLGGPGQ